MTRITYPSASSSPRDSDVASASTDTSSYDLLEDVTEATSHDGTVDPRLDMNRLTLDDGRVPIYRASRPAHRGTNGLYTNTAPFDVPISEAFLAASRETRPDLYVFRNGAPMDDAAAEDKLAVLVWKVHSSPGFTAMKQYPIEHVPHGVFGQVDFQPTSAYGSSVQRFTQQTTILSPTVHAVETLAELTHGGVVFAQDDTGEVLTTSVAIISTMDLEHAFEHLFGGSESVMKNIQNLASFNASAKYVPNGGTKRRLGAKHKLAVHFGDIRDAYGAKTWFQELARVAHTPFGIMEVKCTTGDDWFAHFHDRATSSRIVATKFENDQWFAPSLVHGAYHGQFLLQAVYTGHQHNASQAAVAEYARATAFDWLRTNIGWNDHKIKVLVIVPGGVVNNLTMLHIELTRPGLALEICRFLAASPHGVQVGRVRLFAIMYDPIVFVKPSNPIDRHGLIQLEVQNYSLAFRYRWWDGYGYRVVCNGDGGDDDVDDEPKPPRFNRSGNGPFNGPAQATAGFNNPQHPGMSTFDPAFAAAVMPQRVPVPAYIRPTKSKHNFVDIVAIIEGLDVRTTVMLRNIPNRFTHDSLKELLDMNGLSGLYDFLYLRVDFGSGSNVGYAFLNFISVGGIPKFLRAFSGATWPNSDKVAEVSYATMQGRETLIQKFRNSSVMQELPAYRPKLYYPIGHPLVGLEEPFPGPDNAFKLLRSQQNATTQGLFSPRRNSYRFARRGMF